MSAALQLTYTSALPGRPAAGEARRVVILAEITGEQATIPLPLNLGLVIDCSPSMHIHLVSDDQFAELARGSQAQEFLNDGMPAYQILDVPPEELQKYPRRIDFAAEALLHASRWLRPSDRFSLVAFAGEARTLIPSLPGAERNRLSDVALQLERMNLGEGTHIDEGLEYAFEQASPYLHQPYTSRLILLTDGYTNRIQECYAWAERARQAGLALSTFGIGGDFNEDLLIRLADITHGNAYFIELPSQLLAAFRLELGQALHIAYRNLELSLQLPAEVELHRAHRVIPELSAIHMVKRPSGTFTLALGDFDPSVSQALLLEFVLPARQPGAYRLAQSGLAWEAPFEQPTRQRLQQDIIVRHSGSAHEHPDQRVMNLAEKVEVYTLGMQALDAMQHGAGRRAARGKTTRRLHQTATRLADLGQSALAEAMTRYAQALDNGRVDSYSAKQLRYATRRLAQRFSQTREWAERP